MSLKPHQKIKRLLEVRQGNIEMMANQKTIKEMIDYIIGGNQDRKVSIVISNYSASCSFSNNGLKSLSELIQKDMNSIQAVVDKIDTNLNAIDTLLFKEE